MSILLTMARRPQRSNAARVRNMTRFAAGKLPGNSKTVSKGQKVKDKAVSAKEAYLVNKSKGIVFSL